MSFHAPGVARFALYLLVASTSATVHAAEPWLETFLAPPILAPRQTLIETQIHLASRVKPIPPVGDRGSWERYAAGLRTQILDNVVFRGEAAKWRDLPTRVEWLDTLPGNGYRLKKFRYEVVPGMWLPGLLYEPAQLSGRVPAIVNLNGHEGDGKANSYIQERCINLAKKGMLAYNYEWFGMGEMAGQPNTHYRLNQIDLTGTSGLAAFFLAQKRLVDIALQHPNADPERIGATGLSGGGWQTIVLSSLDTRIKLAMPVAGYSSFVTRAQFPETDLGDSEQTPVDLGVYADYTHLTAMVAPNPLMVAHNARDNCCFRADYAMSPLLVAAKPVFALYGDNGRLRSHANFDPGHNYGMENRETLYRFVHEFFKAGSPEEIPSAADIRKTDELRVPLPQGNESLHSVAVKLSAGLPRAGGDRAKLRDIVRWPEYKVVPRRVNTETAGSVTITKTRVLLNDTWTIPAIEFERSGSTGTTLVLADAGKATLANEIDGLLEQKQRVVAIDPFYFGESKIDTRDFLFAMLMSALGERPLGVQAGQLAAVARWLKQKYGAVSVTAYGPRTGLIAQVAAAADPEAFGTPKVVRPLTSLREVIDRDLSFADAPELFCFGLLEWFDVPQLKALASR
jgi:dienelactone hydrolase